MNRNGEYIYLENGILKVEIALPGTFYNGSRFDWNGFVTQVTLDERHTFCAPESLSPGVGSGGRGLCGEFGIQEPIGYDETVPGGYFPKLGVGNLLKSDASKYDFFRRYDIAPYGTIVKIGKNIAEFSQKAVNSNGYAFRYNKKIKLEDTCLKVEYHLKNNGRKAIRTTEYCHNFIGIDNEKVGEVYVLKFPYDIATEKMTGQIVCVNDRSFTWKDEEWDGQFYCIINGRGHGEDFSWELYNLAAKAGVREYDNFRPCKIALWGMKHVICPEVFIDIALGPGQEMEWSRNYSFYAD